MGGGILIVEDNRENMDLMSYLLRAFGHDVTCAFDGEAGLERAGQRRPDLVVCDLQLPGIDGYEVARLLRALTAPEHLPIVAVTAFAMVGDRERVLAGGFDGYISKPIEPTTFVRQVEDYLPSDRRTTPPVPSDPTTPPPRLDAPLSGHASSGRVGMDVLLVDDLGTSQSLVRAILEPHGIEIRAVPGVDSALAALRLRRPALVLCDVHLAGESGFDLLRAVRADPSLGTVPFVFLTATGRDDRDRDAAFQVGADGYILVPVEPAILIEEVRRWLPGGKP